MRSPVHRVAFTLIELLVVVAIIALLISMLLPSFGRAREQSKALVCKTRLVELYRGHAYYAGEHAGRFPHYDFWLWPGWAEVGGSANPRTRDWVERGQIFRYLRNHEVYFCPKDDKRRVPNTVAIGAGGVYGDAPIHSYVRLIDAHYYGSQHLPPSSDYISPDALLSGVFTPPLRNSRHEGGNYHPWRRGTPVAGRVVMMYEEHQGFEVNAPYQLNDGWSSRLTSIDLMSTRHNNRGHFLFWDGHTELGDAGRYNRHPADEYAQCIVLGGAFRRPQ